MTAGSGLRHSRVRQDGKRRVGVKDKCAPGSHGGVEGGHRSIALLQVGPSLPASESYGELGSWELPKLCETYPEAVSPVAVKAAI